jgi:hypothetical protein
MYVTTSPCQLMPKDLLAKKMNKYRKCKWALKSQQILSHHSCRILLNVKPSARWCLAVIWEKRDILCNIRWGYIKTLSVCVTDSNNNSRQVVNHLVKGKKKAGIRDLVAGVWGPGNPEDGFELRMERRSFKGQAVNGWNLHLCWSIL